LRLLVVRLFGTDLRSLAALRIGLGVAVLLDTAMRARDVVGLYTDAGVLPGRLLEAGDGPLVRLSVHYWAGQHPALQAALFVAGAAAALALIAGWHTRLATAVCWYLVASLQIRQPLGYMGGDSILRMMLFWGLFLPLAARGSVDAARHPLRGRPDWFVSGGTAAVLLQVGIIYWATGLRKSGAGWWNGEAVSIALHQDAWTTALGVWLRDHGTTLTLLTHGTIALELAGPLLAFLPVYTAVGRYVAIALFWSFHLGLASAMNIGLFPVFSMVAWLPFLPGDVWGRLGFGTRAGVSVPVRLRERLLSAVALMCLAYVVVHVAERARLIPRLLPRVVTQVGTALRIQQTWNMFAPEPTRQSTRYVVMRHYHGREPARSPATSSFRWTVYLERAGSRASSNDVMRASVNRFARRQCDWSEAARRSVPRAQRVVVELVRAPIGPEGHGAPYSQTIADVRCAAD